MMETWQVVMVCGAAFGAALLGSVAGSGGTAILLPVLVMTFGVREAIPILAIANLTSNVSRVAFNRREIVLPVALWFGVGAVPCAVAGALLFTITPPDLLVRLLGSFLLLVVAWRRLSPHPPRVRQASWFLPLGAVFGVIAGLLEGVGPLMAPFFLAFGLVRGAYIGTDALSTIFMQVPKLIVFGGAELLTSPVLTGGLLLAPFMVLGTLTGRGLVDRVSDRAFVVIVDLTLLTAGLGFVIRGA